MRADRGRGPPPNRKRRSRQRERRISEITTGGALFNTSQSSTASGDEEEVRGNVVVEGSYATTPQATMAAFDRLPKVVREALAASAENLVAEPFLERWQRGEPATYVARWIADFSDRIVLAYQEDRAAGVGPYQGCQDIMEPRARS